ncbi:MAG: TonB-dependent copper receptor [Sulfuritalea sp.]|nr:TonB-dependent copper receptor [Sulfuritalea sp.]
MPLKRTMLSAALTALPLSAIAADATLDEIVVAAPRMSDPLVVVNDPKAPQAPVPAGDGASFLKNIPGFNVIRKGGTSGDPVLRGLAGSRLNILLDGAEFHGGCGGRMDPPTAYVFPEAFDRVVVVKGPQTVRHGNGNLAGVVLFERDHKPFGAPGMRAFGSAMAGSWGRVDGILDAGVGNPDFHLRALGTHSESDNYEDGDGSAVHSFYRRNSLTLVGGWTPDANTRIELSAVRSEAQAAYADRGMDGTLFDRDGYGVKLEKTRISAVLGKIEVEFRYNYIDHVMDNYSLRTRSAANFAWSNPDRETHGMRARADLNLGAATTLSVGADQQKNSHTFRSGSNPVAPVVIGAVARGEDFRSSITGLFGELTHATDGQGRLIGGIRRDRFAADRFTWNTGAANGSSDENLTGGFLRYERDLADAPATAYVGLGRGERPMDFWEANSYNGLLASRQIAPEKNTQIDLGLVWNGAALSGSVSAYHSRIDDYVLTYRSTVQGPCPTGTLSGATWSCSMNVDATRYGMEADLAWRFAKHWTLRGSYAHVRADNDTMDVPLAQTPPPELKFGLDWRNGPWNAAAQTRLVASQSRVHARYGNIVGQDIGSTPGFSTFAINGSYRFDKRLLLAAGIDNLFDRKYAEHISKAGATIAGYNPATTRVNEPGRFAWIKLNMALD